MSDTNEKQPDPVVEGEGEDTSNAEARSLVSMTNAGGATEEEPEGDAEAGSGDAQSQAEEEEEEAEAESTTRQEEEEPVEEVSSVRLSRAVVPSAYDLNLAPDITRAVFTGTAAITVTIHESVKSVTLHALNLKIQSASIVIGRRQFYARHFKFDDDAQTVELQFSQSLPVTEGTSDTAVLTIVYSGILNSEMAGFYRSSYVDDDGVTQYLATTQFEPADARQAFPCWDEPAFKATFTVTLNVPAGLEAISNMPIVSEEPSTMTSLEASTSIPSRIVRFDTSPIMSTYLVAFVVGQLEYIEDETKNGTKMRVYTRPGRTHQGQFAMDFCKRVLPFFEEYFDIPFPLPKCDLLAIPDFSSGAMENWGCVTYREVMLLIDEQKSSPAVKQRVCRVIAHEIAHSWFGNLATMEWWTHLWLNEGFARWSEHLCVDALEPEWTMWPQFVGDIVSTAYAKDALLSSHPIEVPVSGPDQLHEIFDVISYAKGASVIRMLASYLGADTFRDGLRQYLSKYSYQNGVTEDLWRELSDVSGIDVATLMRNWTGQMGFPVLTAEILPQSPQEIATSIADDGNEYVKVQVTQHRFLKTGQDKDDNSRWVVPITIWFNGTQSRHILDDETAVYRLPLTSDEDRGQAAAIHLNADAAGFYRVNYSQEMLDRLLASVKEGTLPVMERLSLVQDLKALADAGMVPIARLFQVLLSFTSETNYSVWSAIAGAFSSALSLYQQESFYPQLCEFVTHVFGDIQESIGFHAPADDTHVNALLRTHILAVLSKAGDDTVIDAALALFDRDNLTQDRLPPPALRQLVYNAVCKRGDVLEFDLLLGLLRQTDFPEERRRILSAFGHFGHSDDILTRVCHLAISPRVVRPQNCLIPLSAVAARSPAGARIVWAWLQSHYDQVTAHYRGRPTAGVVSLAGHIATHEHADAVDAYFAQANTTGVERSVAQVIEGVRARANRLDRDREQLALFFKSYFQG